MSDENSKSGQTTKKTQVPQPIDKNAGSKKKTSTPPEAAPRTEILAALENFKHEIVETIRETPSKGNHNGHQTIDHDYEKVPQQEPTAPPPDTFDALKKVTFKPDGWEGDFRPVYLSAEVIGDVFSKIRYPYLTAATRLRFNSLLKTFQLISLCFPALMILSSTGRDGNFCTYLSPDTTDIKAFDYARKVYQHVPHTTGYSGKTQCSKHQTEKLLERYRVDSLAAGPMLKGLGQFKHKDQCGYIDPRITSKASEEAKNFHFHLKKYGYADGRPYTLEEKTTLEHIKVCIMEPAELTVAGTSTTIENIILVAMLLLYALFMFTPEPDYQLFTVAYVCSTVLAGFMISSLSIVASRIMAYTSRFLVHLYARNKGYTRFNMDDFSSFDGEHGTSRSREDTESDSSIIIKNRSPASPTGSGVKRSYSVGGLSSSRLIERL